jgi:putative transposase
MSEALAAIFPATTLQTCIVHLIRHSLDYVSWKEREQLAAALRPIYRAPSADAAAAALDQFERSPWGALPDRRRLVATRLDPRDPVLCVSPRKSGA